MKIGYQFIPFPRELVGSLNAHEMAVLVLVLKYEVFSESYETMAAQLDLTYKAILRAVGSLQKKGIIEVKKRYGTSSILTYVYTPGSKPRSKSNELPRSKTNEVDEKPRSKTTENLVSKQKTKNLDVLTEYKSFMQKSEIFTLGEWLSKLRVLVESQLRADSMAHLIIATIFAYRKFDDPLAPKNSYEDVFEEMFIEYSNNPDRWNSLGRKATENLSPDEVVEKAQQIGRQMYGGKEIKSLISYVNAALFPTYESDATDDNEDEE